MKYKVLLSVNTISATLVECIAQFKNLESARIFLRAFKDDAHEAGEDALFWDIAASVHVSLSIEEIIGEV
jgi:hypothetical protein